MPRGKRQRPVPTYVFHFWAFDKETKSFGEPFEFQLDKGMDCKTFEELFQIMTDRTRSSAQHNDDHKKLLQINPQEFILYFDGCNLEWSATPRGIALTEEDAIAAFPKSVFNNVRTILGDNFDECAVNVQEELAQSLASFISVMNETSRKGFIEFGLNPVLKDPIFLTPHMKHFHKGPHKDKCDIEKCQQGLQKYIKKGDLFIVLTGAQDIWLDYSYLKNKPKSMDFVPLLNWLKSLDLSCMDTFMTYIYTYLRNYQVKAISTKETKCKKMGESQLGLANYVYDSLERYCELKLVDIKVPPSGWIYQPLIEYMYKSNAEKSNFELLLENFSFDKSIYASLCEDAYIFSYFAAKDLDFHDMLAICEDYDDIVLERNNYLVKKSMVVKNEKKMIEDFKMKLNEKFQYCDLYEKSLLYSVLFASLEKDCTHEEVKDLGRILLRPKDRMFVIGPPRNDVGLYWGDNACPSVYTRGGNNFTNMTDLLETYSEYTRIKVENVLEGDESLLGEFCEITCTEHPKIQCNLDGVTCEAHSHTTACLDPFFKFQCVIGHAPKYHIALKRKEVPVIDEIDSLVSELEKTDISTNTKKKKNKKKKKGKKETTAETISTNQTTEDLNDLSNVTNESTGDALNEESQINDDDQDIATRIDQDSRILQAQAPQSQTEAEKEKNVSPKTELDNGLFVNDNSTVTNSLVTVTVHSEIDALADNDEEFLSDDSISQQLEEPTVVPEIPEVKKKEASRYESKKKGAKGQPQSNKNSKRRGKKLKEIDKSVNSTAEVKPDIAIAVDSQQNNVNTNKNSEIVGGAKRKTVKSQPIAVAGNAQFVTKYSGLSLDEIHMLEKRHNKELEVLNNEMAELDNGAQQFIKEMHFMLSTTQNRIDKLEDKCHANVKQVAALDDQINELVKKLNKLKSDKQVLVSENVELKRETDALTEERKNLEKVFEMDIGEKNKNKETKMSAILKLEENLSLLKEEKEARESRKGEAQAHESSESSQNNTKSNSDAGPNQAMLLAFMKEQIKTKESDLECPVCMEVSQVPIYTCQEQHIICSECWYKVKMKSGNKVAECVLCRMPYPDPPRHHRYMEKAAQELTQLYAVYSNLLNGL